MTSLDMSGEWSIMRKTRIVKYTTMIMYRDLLTPYSSFYTATLIGEQIYEYYLQLATKF